MNARTSYYKTVSQIHYPSDSTLNIHRNPEPILIVAENQNKENYHGIKNSLPYVFGPPVWFTLHNAASHYPEEASPIYAEKMKNIILSIPLLIPCKTCKLHATAYIEDIKDYLPDICASRKNLFNFFVDFHNFVNKRLDKPIISYDEAKILFPSIHDDEE
jgi:hypothetical protein